MRYIQTLGLCLYLGLVGLAVSIQVQGQIRGTPRSRVIWAKHATALDCRRGAQTIKSPDHLTSMRVICEDRPFGLEVITANGHRQQVGLRFGADELLWAPNSRSFFVNGGFSSYTGFFVDVYQFDESGDLVSPPVTEAAFKDMVKSFPPCKASKRDDAECAKMSRDPEYFNMSGLEWSSDSSAVYVFAEVPCSSRYGGIMCQVLGYEMSVPEGRILKRLSAQETKKEWRRFAAWKINIPKPPEYGSPIPVE